MKGEIGKTFQLIPADQLDEDAEDVLPERYNSSTVIFTGIPKQEFGIYDTDAKKLNCTTEPMENIAVAGSCQRKHPIILLSIWPIVMA
jgi:hypothetical protein